MTEAAAIALLTLLGEAIKEAPELISDVETLLGMAKAAPSQPVVPQLSARTAAALAALRTPVK